MVGSSKRLASVESDFLMVSIPPQKSFSLRFNVRFITSHSSLSSIE